MKNPEKRRKKWCVGPGVAGRYCYLPAPSELDVRVAPHPAQAFTNVPCGTRPLLSVFLARGSADDSWRVVTPCCPPFRDRLGYARSDDGSDSRPLLSAAVDRRPHRPSCLFQRYSIRLQLVRVWVSCQPNRASRYSSHFGSGRFPFDLA